MTTRHKHPFYFEALIVLALPVCCLADAKPAPAQCAKVFETKAQDSVALTWEEGSEARIEVASADGKEHRLKALLGDLGLKDAVGVSLPVSQFIKVSPQPAALTNAGLQISVTVERTTAVKPGVYSGSLILSEDAAGSNGCAVRVPVQLTVRGVVPLTDKLTVHAYRWLPFSSLWTCGECAVPLNGPLDLKTTALRNDVPLGGIQNKEGGAAAVFWTGGQSVSSEGISQLPVSLRGLDGAGQYEGQLKLDAAGNKAQGVSLSVDASDIVAWPILVIGASVWLGLRAQRYINVTRAVWLLREEEAALGDDFKESQRRFVEGTRATPSAGYSISEALKNERRALREKISGLQTNATLSLDTAGEPYQSMLAAFKKIREAIALWGDFTDELSSLRAALGTQADAGAPPPNYEGQTPALLQALASLLVGRSLTLADLTQTDADVRAAIAAAQLWHTLKDRLDKDSERFQALVGFSAQLTQDQQSRLTAAGQKLAAERVGLWDADTAESLSGIASPGGDLDSAEQELRGLLSEVGGAHPAAASAALTTGDLITHGDIGLLSKSFAKGAESPAEPAGDAEREQFYARAMRRWDRRLTLLAFAVATLGGLNQYYLGKPFGTVKDYVALILIGLGTRVALEAAGAAFGWLFRAATPGQLPGHA